MQCLMDIAKGELLNQELQLSVRSDFVNWQENMQLLRKGGKIDDEIYEQFKEG